MLRRQHRQRAQRPVPVVARLMRIDGGGVEQPAGAVDDRDLDAGADARVEPHGDALASRRRQQQVAEVAAEDATRLGLGRLAQALLDVEFEVDRQLETPGPAHGLDEPRVGRPPAVLDADVRRHPPLRLRAHPGRQVLLGQHHRQPQHALVAPAQQGERAMRRHRPHGLGGAEVVGELRALLLLAGNHGRLPLAPIPEQLPQGANELGVLGELLDENPAGPLERRGDVGDAALGIHERRRLGLGVERRVLPQPMGQRLEPGLTRDLSLRPPLRLTAGRDLRAGLGVGRLNLRRQFRCELALSLDALENRRPSCLSSRR